MYNFQLNPSVPLSTDIPGFVTIPHLSDKIHCVVFVIDGSTIDVMPEKVIERMKALQSRMNQKGQYKFKLKSYKKTIRRSLFTNK